MVKPPKLTFLAREDALKDALEQVQRQGLDGLPVMEDGQLVGVLTRRAAALFVRTKQVAPPEAAAAAMDEPGAPAAASAEAPDPQGAGAPADPDPKSGDSPSSTEGEGTRS